MLQAARFMTLFGLLSAGCLHVPGVIPDPEMPHLMAEDATVTAWCHVKDDIYTKCEIRLIANRDYAVLNEALPPELRKAPPR